MSWTEWLHFHFSLSCTGEGNGNPLQCSCLENPRDGGAWWTAVYGVAQSRTRLTLCHPKDYSPPDTSVHGIFQARVLEWGVIAFSAFSSSSKLILEKGSNWPRLGHIPFPGPITVPRRMRWGDWLGLRVYDWLLLPLLPRPLPSATPPVYSKGRVLQFGSLASITWNDRGATPYKKKLFWKDKIGSFLF